MVIALPYQGAMRSALITSPLPAFTALAAFAALLFAPQIFNDGDTYWHIAAGARMIDARAVLHTDPFSYTFQGKPWDAHEWLSEVVMALAWRAGGWGALAVLFASAFALTIGIVAKALSRFLPTQTTLIVLVLAASCMAPSLLARPHLLALPLLALWTASLVAARAERRAPSLSLLPTMTLWANLHGGFVFGLVLLAYFAIEALVEERNLRTFVRWAAFGIGAVIAASLTPTFVDGLLFPFRLIGTTNLAHVGEWQAADFSRIQPFEIALFAALFFFVTRGVKLPLGRSLVVLVLLHMALSHLRHQIVFAVTVPVLLAEPAAASLDMKGSAVRMRPLWAATSFCVIVALGLLRLSLTLPRGGGAATPEAALAHVPQALTRTHVLNDYSFGGYLIFEGVRPFIDSRAELYGDAFLGDYATIIRPDPNALKTALAKYDVRWTIFPPASPVVAELDALPGWRRLYADGVAVVHARDNP
jgi:hypothetical protein